MAVGERDLAHPPLWAPKRRVAARVRLIDGRTLDGALYADVQRLDGTRASVVDRLHDAFERYIPLATEGRHVLLQKSAVVTVHLPGDEVEPPAADGVREFRVALGLAAGEPVRGRLFALLPPAQSRALDFLNRTAQPFVELASGDELVLVNTEHVVTVTELLG